MVRLVPRTPVKTKNASVNLKDLDVTMQPILDAIRYRGDMVTSGAEGSPGDGLHSARSLHYPQNNEPNGGLAVDVRLIASDQISYYDRVLPLRCTILDEGNHVHLSYDPTGQRR